VTDGKIKDRDCDEVIHVQDKLIVPKEVPIQLLQDDLQFCVQIVHEL